MNWNNEQDMIMSTLLHELAHVLKGYSRKSIDDFWRERMEEGKLNFEKCNNKEDIEDLISSLFDDSESVEIVFVDDPGEFKKILDEETKKAKEDYIKEKAKKAEEERRKQKEEYEEYKRKEEETKKAKEDEEKQRKHKINYYTENKINYYKKELTELEKSNSNLYKQLQEYRNKARKYAEKLIELGFEDEL